METDITKYPLPTTTDIRGLLKVLGFSHKRKPRWEVVAPKVKDKIVAARRANNDKDAVFWGEAKSLLDARLLHSCIGCSGPVDASSLRCSMCSIEYRHPTPNPFAR